MESDYVPLQVKSGVRKGSEEGTEVIVKHKYVEEIPLKRTLYHMGTFLSWLGLLLMMFGPLLVYGMAWLMGTPYIAPWVVWMYLISEIFGVMILILGVFLYNRRERFVTIVKEEKETQMAIFFPNISIANINDIIGIHTQTTIEAYVDHRYDALKFEHPEWRNVIFEYNTKILYVRGYGVHGEEYWVELQSPDLYDRMRQAYNEFLRQEKLRKYQERIKELEYLEKVGRYEEAARIYEDLDMPEKAGEMRRKKREAEVVRVDLNALIRQLGERGFTITYNCSHCGAPLNISVKTKVETIQSCSHCGSRIEIIDLARLIERYLS